MKRETHFLNATARDKEYNDKQFQKVYRSTVAFCDWLSNLGIIDISSKQKVLDLGSGQGANLYYMSQRYPNSQFTGVDLHPGFVDDGNKRLKKLKAGNCHLEVGDIYDLDVKYIHQYDGIVSYQTLSFLKEFSAPLKKMIGLRPKWIALTSLFFDGDVNCEIKIQDYSTPQAGNPYWERNYNIYSLPLVKELLAQNGYPDFNCIPFQIDTDLPKPVTRGMGTYTEKTVDGRRIQISGPVLMNWYFILARRTK